MTSISDPRPGQTQSFVYDALYRLTGVWGYQSMSFTYDALGNRTSGSGTEYQFEPNTLRHMQSTGIESDFSIQHDANVSVRQTPS